MGQRGSTRGADYVLSIAAIIGLAAIFMYLRLGGEEPRHGPEVFASTAGPPPPVQWSEFARPECPHCSAEIASHAGRCTSCGRQCKWCTAACTRCDCAAHAAASSDGPCRCGCRCCGGDGILGND